ncbi:hypothetical protein PVL29_004768 [Vitis rotundifolia]|uniref:Uncharacterized protein n=1 Tax=Vitis rotundifolia TaxID=103349 RepID=A0AA39A8V0_VITRO|nr:hypothetical protein PVL29_004768 [Vitis rotundifolia]
MFKTQPVRAQSGTIYRGLQAGLVASQAHETVALSSSLRQRAGSFAKAISLFAHSQGPIEGRADDVDFFGEDGRAFEIKAQSLPNPSPPSDVIVGRNLKGPSWLGQSLKGKKSFVKKGRSRRKEDDAVSKGKAPEGRSRGSAQKEELVVSKKMWTTLFPLSFDRRQGLRSCSEPIFPVKPSSVSEARLLEEDFGMGSQLEQRCSGEGTSSSSGVAALRNPRFEEDKEGSMGRVGSDFVVLQSRIHLLVQKSKVKGSSLRRFVNFREWKIRRYVYLLLLSHPSLLLPFLVVWHFLCRSLFLSLLWKIELFLKFCLIKTLLALFFKIMLAFLSVMRW